MVDILAHTTSSDPASQDFVPPATGLAANNIGKAYRGRVVVKDITLTVQRGEVVALMGPNGAGKTTSFYMIMGLIEADRGMITLDGQDITSLPMYQRGPNGVKTLTPSWTNLTLVISAKAPRLLFPEAKGAA